jgi:hypothetical protein
MLAFVGFSIGRISHIIGGHLKAPHHWIYGIILILFGIIFYQSNWGFYLLSFGVGLLISDLKDFLAMKFYGIDEVKEKKFWGID